MGKRMEAAKKAFDAEKLYTFDEAAQIVKDNAKAKFDETVELHVSLGIDTKKADQQVRTTVVLPHGTGKTKRIAVIAKGEKAQEAQKAGADKVGAEDIVDEVIKGKIDFDVLVATPDTMKDLAKAAKILGPRGLMPNPKVGTVTRDVAQAVKNAKSGQVRYRNDKTGVIQASIGKVNFTVAQLTDNLNALLGAITKAKPASSKGTYIKKVCVSTTMGGGVTVEKSSLNADTSVQA